MKLLPELGTPPNHDNNMHYHRIFRQLSVFKITYTVNHIQSEAAQMQIGLHNLNGISKKQIWML